MGVGEEFPLSGFPEPLRQVAFLNLVRTAASNFLGHPAEVTDLLQQSIARSITLGTMAQGLKLRLLGVGEAFPLSGFAEP